MFPRIVTVRKPNKTYQYLVISESVRIPGKGSTTRNIANLGNIEKFQSEDIASLIDGLIRLFELDRYALTEDIHFHSGKLVDRNFDTYKIPRFSDLPIIETVLLDDPDSPPQGGGEPVIITMGAVIANAIYNAIGVRLFQLPMTPERIRKALITLD